MSGSSRRGCGWLLAVCLALAAAPAPSVPQAVIATQPDSRALPKQTAIVANANDDALSRRLGARLRSIEGLEDVTATVVGGVARLDGVVVDPTDLALATQVARQQPGITRVDSRVQLSANISDRFEAAMRQAMLKLVRLLAAAPLLAVAIAIVVVAWWLGRTLGHRIRLTRLSDRNPYIDGLLRRVSQWVILLIGILLALDLLGATTLVGAVLGSAGVVGLVLGFAFKDIAENYVAGTLLSLRRPFAPGDHLVIASFEGKVVALTSRVTLLMTLDGNELSLPNALVFKSVVLNYTRNPNRRFDFVVPIDPVESVGRAQQLALAAIGAIEGVLDTPAPSVLVDGYVGSGINLRFFGWIDQRRSDLGKVRSESIRAVKGAFADARIETPRSTHYVFTAPTPGPDDVQPVAQRERDGSADTSVNHDIDDQLDAERHARGGENLL